MERYWIKLYRDNNSKDPTVEEISTAMKELNAQEKGAFKLYNKADLERRSIMIAGMDADLTLYLHFNGSEKEPFRDENNHTIAKEENFNMAFIAGSFSKSKEIKTEPDRKDFIRWATSPEKLTLSKKLCSHMLELLEKRTNVPLAHEEDAEYLKNFSMPAVDESGETYEGVFHRNLYLTRKSTTPHCYLESLIQDNFEEAQKLGKQNRQILGISTSARVFKVAKAYFIGIKKFVAENACKDN